MLPGERTIKKQGKLAGRGTGGPSRHLRGSHGIGQNGCRFLFLRNCIACSSQRVRLFALKLPRVSWIPSRSLGHGAPVFYLVDLSERRMVKTKKIRLGILCGRAGAGMVEKRAWGPHSSTHTCYLWEGRIASTPPWTVTHRLDKGMENEFEQFNYR